MRINCRCNNFNDMYYLDTIQKRNLKDLIDILSTAIENKNKPMLMFMLNNWDLHYQHILKENNFHYKINNTNQINHIEILMQEAKFIITSE